MTDIKRRQPTVQTGITQGQIIATLVLGVYSQIGQALAPGVIGRPIQSLGEALPELNLQAVVAAPTAVIHKVQAACGEGVEQEEVDRISPRLVGSRLNPCARAEVAAEHAANIDLVSGQRVSYGPSLAVLELGDEVGVLVPICGSNRPQRASRAKGRVEDGQRRLARASQI